MSNLQHESVPGIRLDRVVAVVLRLSGGLEQVGSGYLISRDFVLTAEHCTRDKLTGAPATSIRVIRASDGKEVSASVRAASPALDVAVLQLGEALWLRDVPAVRFGRVDRTTTGELADCVAVGFPSWQYNPSDLSRDTAELHGFIRATEDVGSGYLVLRDPLLETVAVPASSAAEPSTRSPWGGLSGALVFHSGLALGVVVQHQPRQGDAAIRIIPFDRIFAAQDDASRAVVTVLGIRSADTLQLARTGSVLAAERPSKLGQIFMVPDVPGTTIARVELTERLAAALAASSTQPADLVVALEGIGGCGKTTLARVVCKSPAIREAFPRAVLWVTVGQGRTGAALADLINGLCQILVPDETVTFSDPMLSGATLGTILETGEPTLLVIDDVWINPQLEPFLVAGAKCRRLVITRNRDVVPGGALQLEVGDMTYSETVAMLTRQVHGLPPENLDVLVRLTGRWPVLAGLVNGALAGYVGRSGATAQDAAAWITRRLQQEGPGAFDRSPRDRAVAATVRASLELLESNEQDCYLDLAILRGATDIGTDVLELLWVASGRLAMGAAHQLQERITDLRLADGRWRAGGPTLRMHDVIRDYLRYDMGEVGRIARNRRFIEVARKTLAQRSGGRREKDEWWSLPSDATYLWHNLAYHTSEAGAHDELAETVCDLRWIKAKINATGSAVAAEADLALVDSDVARLLRRGLAQSSSLLIPTSPESTLAVTLVSRLDRIVGLEQLVRSFSAELPRPRLENWLAPPDQPDPALVRDLVGHTDWIWSCLFSPVGGLLATASGDLTVRIWDAVSGQLRTRFAWHADANDIASAGMAEDAMAVTALAFSPTGAVLATGGYDHIVRLWEAETGRLVADLRGHDGWVRCCAFTPDGTRLATAGDDRTVRIWEMPEGRHLQTLQGHAGPVHGCVFQTDSSLETASEDGTVRLWDVSSGQDRVLLEGIYGTAMACAFSSDGNLVASGSDGRIHIWDVAAGRHRAVFQGLPGTPSACAFSPDATLLAAASDGDFQTFVWQVDTTELQTVYRGHTARIRSCAFSADSRLLVTGGDDRTGRVWEVGVASSGPEPSLQQDWVRGCAFSPDGSLVVTASDDRTARIWDAATGELRLTLSGSASAVSACIWSADGRTIITGDFGGTVHAYDADTGSRQQELTGLSGPIFTCAISARTSRLAAACADRTVKLWDYRTWRPLTILNHDDWVYGCAFSPEGSLIATTGDDCLVRVWDIAGESATCITALRVAQPLFACTWQPTGDKIYAGGRAGIYAWTLLR